MKKFDDQILKFILVGIANTLVGMTIMFGLYNIFHCSYFFFDGYELYLWQHFELLFE